jgi:hypothetical protein
MPFYGREFYADENVLVMNLEQEGAYLRLLWLCWQEGSIPPDTVKLAAMCKNVSARKFERTIWPALVGCFTPTPDGRLIHPKVEALRAAKDRFRDECSTAGKRGAEIRWRNRKDPSGEGMGYLIETPSNPDGVSMPVDCRLPIADCRLPNTHTEEPVRVARKAADLSSNDPPSCRFDEAWQRWPLKVERDAAARAWTSLVNISNEALVFACIDRFLASGQAGRGAISEFANWLFKVHRDNWASQWPPPPKSSVPVENRWSRS